MKEPWQNSQLVFIADKMHIFNTSFPTQMKNSLAVRMETTDKNVCVLFLINEFILDFLIACLFLHSIEVCTFHCEQCRQLTQSFSWKDLVNSLPRASKATYDSKHVNDISMCHKNTRTSVLGKIADWIQDDDNKSVFWLNGMAGIGKTTIARTTLEQNKDNKQIMLASLFFSKDDARARDPLLVFPTLAYQLACQRTEMMTSLAKMVQENPNCAAHPLNKQFSEFLTGPLTTLGSSYYTILIILDALDECSSNDDASEILRLLLSHASTTPYKLRILVTSRPEKYIRDEFADKSQNYAMFVLHDIERKVVNGDIELFVRHKLEAIFTKKNLPMPQDKDIIQLVEKSDKLFIYAATALRFIDDKGVGNPQRQLSIILDSSKPTYDNPYSDVDNLYTKVLENAISKESTSQTWIAKRNYIVVGTIVMLREPLSLAALAVFTKLSMEDTKSALGSLQSVIVTPDSNDETPRIFNPSFSDFITDKERCMDSRFLVDVRSREISLAQRCLELMVDSLGHNTTRIENEAVRNVGVIDLEINAEKALPSELRYACLHWASHMIATEHADEKCLSLLHKFTNGNLLNWMEVMSLLGDIPHAILMMRDVYAWIVSGHRLDYAVTDDQLI